MTISKKEWRWVAIWAGLMMLITSLPYLYGLFLSTPPMQFGGFILGVEDGNSYLAKMRQGAAGGWLFYLPYTPEPHAGAYVYTFYLLLGKIARFFHLPHLFIHHTARIGFGLGLLFTVYGFIAYFLESVSARRLAFLLVAAGSGLGWLLIALQLTPVLGLPLDMYLPEAFIFLVLLHLPHTALAESLLFGAVLLMWHSWAAERWQPAIWAGLALLVMASIAAFYLPVFMAVLGATWLVLTVAAKSISKTWSFLLKMIAGVMIAMPVLGYYLYVFTVNPVFKVWSQQNTIRSPEPWHYLFAYGLWLTPALYGSWLLWRREISRGGTEPQKPGFLLNRWHKNPVSFEPLPKNLLLITWSLIFPILVYLPINIQRRLVVGVQLPLAILATYALQQLAARYVPPDKQRMAGAGVILFFSLTNIFLLAGGLISVSFRSPPIFHPASQMAAIHWLDDEARGAVVMAAYETGNVLPAYAGVRVFVGHGPETVHSDEKRAQANLFFSATPPDKWRLALLRKFNIRYVYYGPDEKASGGFAPEHAPYLRERYQNEEVQIFEVDLP